MLRILIPIVLILLLVFLYYKEYEGFENSVLTSVIPPQQIPLKQDSKQDQVPSNTIVPSVSVSGTAYDAMSLQQRSELLKDIQQVVKNDILANRQTEVVPVQSNINQTNGMQQGQEFNINKQKTVKHTQEHIQKQSYEGCPLVPDMSEYIRKDQIPCWNCTLDY